MNHKKLVTGLLALSILACPATQAAGTVTPDQKPSRTRAIINFFAEKAALVAGAASEAKESAQKMAEDNDILIGNITPMNLFLHAAAWKIATKAVQNGLSGTDIVKLSASSFTGVTAHTLLAALSNKADEYDRTSMANGLNVLATLSYVAGQNPETIARLYSSLKKDGFRQSFENTCEAVKNFFVKDGDFKGRLVAVANTLGPVATIIYAKAKRRDQRHYPPLSDIVAHMSWIASESPEALNHATVLLKNYSADCHGAYEILQNALPIEPRRNPFPRFNQAPNTHSQTFF